MTKKHPAPPAATRPPKTPLALWLLLVAALLPANILAVGGFLHPAPSSDAPLAELRGEKFYRSQLSPQAATVVERYEKMIAVTTKADLDRWASDILFKAEAERTGRTVNQLVEEEINAKAAVGDAEVEDVYRRAPAAAEMAYPEVLAEIRKELKQERLLAARRQLIDRLGRAEGLRIYLPESSEKTDAPAGSRFRPYVPPAAPASPAGPVTGPPSRGPDAAPVVLEIYSDFYCPFSRRFSEIARQLEARYPQDLRVVFHHLPLPMHPGAEKLAEASACAQEQGKFWEMHDALMAWEGPPDAAKLGETAQKIGADPAAFSACLSDGRYVPFVQREKAAAQAAGANGTPTFLLNGRLGVGALPVEQLAAKIEWFRAPKGEYPGAPPAPPSAPGGPPADEKPVDFPKDWLNAGPSQGKADAPVTLVEFIDFHCPFCQRGAEAVRTVVEPMKSKVRFISKQYPLPMHPNAQNASVAALCAGQQGRYWEYRSEIFGGSWGKQSPDDMKAAASNVGLNRKKFDKCLDGSETLETVKKDLAAAAAAGVNATPTYFVNGKRIVGANPDLLKQLLEEAASPKK